MWEYVFCDRLFYYSLVKMEQKIKENLHKQFNHVCITAFLLRD